MHLARLFLLMNTGNTPIRSENGLLTSAGWRIGDDVTYVLRAPSGRRRGAMAP